MGLFRHSHFSLRGCGVTTAFPWGLGSLQSSLGGLWGHYSAPSVPQGLGVTTEFSRGLGISIAFSLSPRGLWGHYRAPSGAGGHYSALSFPPGVMGSLQSSLLSHQGLWCNYSLPLGVVGSLQHPPPPMSPCHCSAPCFPLRSCGVTTAFSQGLGVTTVLPPSPRGLQGGDLLRDEPTDLWGEKGSKEAMFLLFTLFPHPKTPQFHPISLWGAGQEAVSSPSHFSPTLKHSDPIAHPYWVFPGRATFPHFTPFPHPKTAQSHQSPL